MSFLTQSLEQLVMRSEPALVFVVSILEHLDLSERLLQLGLLFVDLLEQHLTRQVEIVEQLLVFVKSGFESAESGAHVDFAMSVFDLERQK